MVNDITFSEPDLVKEIKIQLEGEVKIIPNVERGWDPVHSGYIVYDGKVSGSINIISNRPYTDLSCLYRVESDFGIYEFIETHPYLYPVFSEVHTRLQKYFPNTEMTLEIFDDPESTDRELAVIVHTNLEPEEALEKLDFFDDWWITNSADVLSNLSIHVAYL